jgi:transcriptional regulator with XRE-family HTH domain
MEKVMVPRTIAGSTNTGTAIRSRRLALGLSVEDVAKRAGVGSKTWSRYESGASIRVDKVRGVCRALGWVQLPDNVDIEDDASAGWIHRVDKDHPAWSDALEKGFGRSCAVIFAVGSDILGDSAAEDLEALSKEPRWTHIGQLSASMLDGLLPPQFVTRYDYEFIYSLKSAVDSLRKRFAIGALVANSVIEELALYLIFRHAEVLSEYSDELLGEVDEWIEWVGDILGDIDVVTFLYSTGIVLAPSAAYHFGHWLEPQFWQERS